MDENFMTRTQIEMAEGRRRLKELQGQTLAEQTLGAQTLGAQSGLSPMTEQFAVVDLPALPSRKKKKSSEVDELLASLQAPKEEDDGDRDPD